MPSTKTTGPRRVSRRPTSTSSRAANRNRSSRPLVQKRTTAVAHVARYEAARSATSDGMLIQHVESRAGNRTLNTHRIRSGVKRPRGRLDPAFRNDCVVVRKEDDRRRGRANTDVPSGCWPSAGAGDDSNSAVRRHTNRRRRAIVNNDYLERPRRALREYEPQDISAASQGDTLLGTTTATAAAAPRCRTRGVTSFAWIMQLASLEGFHDAVRLTKGSSSSGLEL